jgi:hypothetical protein
VWTVPAVVGGIVPVWSSEARCQAAIDRSEAMVPYEPERVPLPAFLADLPAIAKRGHRLGLDWTGRQASGPTATARDLAAAFRAGRPPSGLTVRSLRRG